MSTPMPTFKYMRAWGRLMGSNDRYINHEIALACDNGAPATAIYYKDDQEKYALFDEIANPMVKKQIENMVEKLL